MNDTPTCSQKDCDSPAAVKYHWLSQPMFACIEHATAAGNIGKAMGMPIAFEPVTIAHE